MKTLMTQLALALALCVPAFAEDALPTLPAGQVELTDVLSPEEIYSEMLGTGEELDLAKPPRTIPKCIVFIST